MVNGSVEQSRIAVDAIFEEAELVESRCEVFRRHAKSTRRFGVRNYSTAFGSISSTEDEQLFKNIGCIALFTILTGIKCWRKLHNSIQTAAAPLRDGEPLTRPKGRDPLYSKPCARLPLPSHRLP